MPMKNIYIAVFVSTILIWGFYCICFGIGMSSDSWQYSGWADVLVSKSFNINAYLRSIDFIVPPYLYLGFISVVAFSKIVAGMFWQQAIVIINVLLGAFLAVILANLIYIFTKNKIVVCLISSLFILSPEIMLWSRFVLSDISYMFINFFLFYLLVKFLLSNNKRMISYGGIIILTLLLNCIYRPTGLVMIPAVLIVFYLKMAKKEMSWVIFFFCFVFIAAVLIFFHSLVIKDPESWPFEFGKSYLKNWVIVAYQKGMVVHNRLNTYHQVPITLGDYISITLDKFMHYFYFYDKMFKLYHKIINYIFFTPLYALFILGAIAGSKKPALPNIRSLIALAIMVIISFSLFHAMMTIDHDWRYRLPVFPYLLLIAGVGLNFMLRSFTRHHALDFKQRK